MCPSHRVSPASCQGSLCRDKGSVQAEENMAGGQTESPAHVWDSAGRSAKGMERRKGSEEQDDVSIREVISGVANHGRDNGHGITWAQGSGRNLGLKLS